MMRYFFYILPLLAVLFLLVLFGLSYQTGRDPAAIPSPLVGKEAPDAAFFKNKVSIVNFFASWCVPCRAEHGLLSKLRVLPGVQMLGVAYKDKTEDTQKFLAEMGSPFSALWHDTRGKTGLNWGITGVPESFVVGPDGIVRYHFAGPLGPDQAEEIARWVRKLSAP